MLFDLRGRRRRAVQATYLTLALLMGGGLVLFGVGSNVSGGLFDIFGNRGGGGSSSGNDALHKRIDSEEKQLSARPQDVVLLKALVRDYYADASSQVQSGASSFPKDARDELVKSASYWERYLTVEKGTPDSGLARLAVQLYNPGALNKPKQAEQAARIVAAKENSSAAYLQLVASAAAAGDTRIADLAAQKAVDLAPKAQRKAVKQQAEMLKKPMPQTQGG